MSSFEEFRQPTPEQQSGESFNVFIRDSLCRLETPAPRFNPSEIGNYTDWDRYGRRCRTDGTVIFGVYEDAMQLSIGESHVLALAYHEQYELACAVIYRYDAEGRLWVRSMFENRGGTVNKHWLKEQPGNWCLRPSTSNSLYFTRRLINDSEVNEQERLHGIIKTTIDRPQNTGTPEALNEFLRPNKNEALLIERNRRKQRQILPPGKEIVDVNTNYL